jgi:hypothetical protein
MREEYWAGVQVCVSGLRRIQPRRYGESFLFILFVLFSIFLIYFLIQIQMRFEFQIHIDCTLKIHHDAIYLYIFILIILFIYLGKCFKICYAHNICWDTIPIV